mmetsp:Transcript_26168/g.83605  ORF Transcript_26168/g.83605 Transcript_26168/m.83605 type:complete len:274 (+) Transcript_26168:434-1255(+)
MVSLTSPTCVWGRRCPGGPLPRGASATCTPRDCTPSLPSRPGPRKSAPSPRASPRASGWRRARAMGRRSRGKGARQGWTRAARAPSRTGSQTRRGGERSEGPYGRARRGGGVQASDQAAIQRQHDHLLAKEDAGRVVGAVVPHAVVLKGESAPPHAGGRPILEKLPSQRQGMQPSTREDHPCCGRVPPVDALSQHQAQVLLGYPRKAMLPDEQQPGLVPGQSELRCQSQAPPRLEPHGKLRAGVQRATLQGPHKRPRHRQALPGVALQCQGCG